MKWQLRDFSGQPGEYSITMKLESKPDQVAELKFKVDKDGCFNVDDLPADFPLGILAKKVA